MKKIFVLFWICLFWIMPVSVFSERMTDNWRLMGFTKYRDAVFADMARLSSPTPDTKAVWVKIAPSGKSKYRQSIREYLDTAGIRDKKFKSIEILCEIHCTHHLIRFTGFVYLDDNRNIIHEAYETNPQWLQIIQGNTWYPVEKAACAAK